MSDPRRGGPTGRDTEPPAETRSVELPESLATRVEDRLAPTRFESVDRYVTFCVERLLREVERSADDGETDRPTETAADEATRERLESLGYL